MERTPQVKIVHAVGLGSGGAAASWPGTGRRRRLHALPGRAPELD